MGAAPLIFPARSVQWWPITLISPKSPFKAELQFEDFGQENVSFVLIPGSPGVSGSWTITARDR